MQVTWDTKNNSKINSVVNFTFPKLSNFFMSSRYQRERSEILFDSVHSVDVCTRHKISQKLFMWRKTFHSTDESEVEGATMNHKNEIASSSYSGLSIKSFTCSFQRAMKTCERYRKLSYLCPEKCWVCVESQRCCECDFNRSGREWERKRKVKWKVWNIDSIHPLSLEHGRFHSKSSRLMNSTTQRTKSCEGAWETKQGQRWKKYHTARFYSPHEAQ